MGAKVKTAIVAILLTSAAAAASGSAVEEVLDQQEIEALLIGKTFHYSLFGASRGEESHSADGRAVWRLPDGTCYHGVWVASGPLLCYYYGAMRYGCWSVVRGLEGYRHEPRDLDGTPGTGPAIVIERISEEAVSCAPQMLSGEPHSPSAG